MDIKLSIPTDARPATGHSSLSDLVLMLHGQRADTVNGIFKGLEELDPQNPQQVAGAISDAQELQQVYQTYSDVLYQVLLATLRQEPGSSQPLQP